MVDNVIDNAVGHNEPGGWVRVATAVKDKRARSSSRTAAQSLTPTRSSSSPSRSGASAPSEPDRTSGAGLGLAIVSSIVEVHGGTLDLEALTDGGLRVTISLPLAVRTAAGAPA